MSKTPVELLVETAQDMNTTKADILQIIQMMCSGNNDLKKIFGGEISDEAIEEIRISETANDKLKYSEVGYEKNENNEILMDKVVKYKKHKDPVSLYVKEPTKEEARYLSDMYYQVQKFRISIQNQIRAIDQGVDQDDKTHLDSKTRKAKGMVDTPATMAFRHDMLDNLLIMEDNVKRCLEEYSDRLSMGKWIKANVGFGPVFATVLCANLDIADPRDRKPTEIMPSVGTWISYCGLNDNNRPWIKNDDLAKKFVDDAIEETTGDPKVITDETVYNLCAKTQWKFDHYKTACTDKKTGKFKWDREKLIKATKKIPYNADLKKTMYLIGTSIVKNKNRANSYYGKLYKERYEYEAVRNEAGYNEQYCAKALASKHYSKSTETYKCYSKGKIPSSQINMRAMRWTCKIFLSHLFAYEYENKFGMEAPLPYIFTVDDNHKDLIPPGVPFDEIPFDHI